MRKVALRVAGAYLIESERVEDDRGFFLRAWSAADFDHLGLECPFTQCALSHNSRRATLRGLHLQAPPHEEVKLVRCTRGEVFDVVADLRPSSPTYGRWDGVQLSGREPHAIYIPAGCAHGFITLADDSDVLYLISGTYVPAAARGVRWNDPNLGIRWPVAHEIFSARDAALPSLADLAIGGSEEGG